MGLIRKDLKVKENIDPVKQELEKEQETVKPEPENETITKQELEALIDYHLDCVLKYRQLIRDGYGA